MGGVPGGTGGGVPVYPVCVGGGGEVPFRVRVPLPGWMAVLLRGPVPSVGGGEHLSSGRGSRCRLPPPRPFSSPISSWQPPPPRTHLDLCIHPKVPDRPLPPTPPLSPPAPPSLSPALAAVPTVGRSGGRLRSVPSPRPGDAMGRRRLHHLHVWGSTGLTPQCGGEGGGGCPPCPHVHSAHVQPCACTPITCSRLLLARACISLHKHAALCIHTHCLQQVLPCTSIQLFAQACNSMHTHCCFQQLVFELPCSSMHACWSPAASCSLHKHACISVHTLVACSRFCLAQAFKLYAHACCV